MYAATLTALAMLAIVTAYPTGHIEEHHAPAPYSYKYSVHDPHHGDVKSHHESRHGDQVKGSYTVVEPDGHVRKVEYTADKHNGFQAIVTREGKVSLHGYGDHDTQDLGGHGGAHAPAPAPIHEHNFSAGHGAGFGAGFGAGHGAGIGAGAGAGHGHLAGLEGVHFSGHGNAAGHGAGYGAGYGAGFGAGHGHHF